MTGIWAQAALWLGLALIATLLSIWLKVATALSEIVVGTIAQLVIGAMLGSAILAGDASWLKFLAGAGAIVLTFLAGAELDPLVFRRQWKQAGAIGLISFLVPFLGCAAIARYILGWSGPASWLAGIAMSTTSVAVVYAVMLEFGLNRTDYGKTVLAACFITDLATVVALGLLFAPFSMRTLTFGLLTPFYFIRAGSLVSIPALMAAPTAMLILLVAKMVAKILGVYPVTRIYGAPRAEAAYTTMLMATGLTFGTIAALFGLSHGVIDQAQYSALVAAVVLSAVVPTLVANAFFLPRHLIDRTAPTDGAAQPDEEDSSRIGAGGIPARASSTMDRARDPLCWRLQGAHHDPQDSARL